MWRAVPRKIPMAPLFRGMVARPTTTFRSVQAGSNLDSRGLRLSRRIVSAIHFLADDCEARGGCLDRIGFPRKSDRRHADSSLEMAFGTASDEPKLLRRVLLLDSLPCGFPNHFERHSRRCGD